MIRRLLHLPATHFLVLGAVLFGARTWLDAPGPAGAPADPLHLPAVRIEALRREWALEMGRPPGREELAARIQQAVDDEILYREALALGLDRTDPIVRRRLILNMRFLARDTARGDEDLLEEAFRLGMNRTDIVVRRRLIQKMSAILRASAPGGDPTPREIRSLPAARQVTDREPARVRLWQVYLDREARGETLERDARRLLARLRQEPVPPERAPDLGDPFLLGPTTPLLARDELARRFGDGFARAVMTLAPGRWWGPVESIYGLHLVWIEERTPERVRDPAAVRRDLEPLVREAREHQALRQGLVALRTRYAVQLPAGFRSPAQRSGTSSTIR